MMKDDPQIANYLKSLLEGDRVLSSKLINAYLDASGNLKDLYEKIVKTALYEVGSLWESNKIGVAEEHLATAIVESNLNELLERIVSEYQSNKKVVLACTENEMHQVGIKMVGDVFELNGWNTFFLGSSVPRFELIKFIKEKQPDILAISLSIYFNYSTFLQMLSELRKHFPTLPIVAGGQAFNHIKPEILSSHDHLHFFTDLYELETFIKSKT